MKRRQAIKYVATLLGGTFSAPTLLAMNNWTIGVPRPTLFGGFKLSDKVRCGGKNESQQAKSPIRNST